MARRGCGPTTPREPVGLTAAVALLLPLAAAGQALVVEPANSPYAVTTPTSFDAVRVRDGGVLVANAKLTVAGDFVVEGGGLVTVTRPTLPDGGALEAPALELQVAGRLEVAVNGRLDVSAMGCPAKWSVDPATGRCRASGCVDCAGSHFARGARGAAAFDDPRDPRLPGGAGDDGRGGGVILAAAAGMVLDGRLSADGEDLPLSAQETGAGGSLNLTAARFSGAGHLSARPGTSLDTLDWAGGGLVRLAGDTSAFTGSVDVVGGAPMAQHGTVVFLQDGTLEVAGGQHGLGSGDLLDRLALRPDTRAVLTGRPQVGAPIEVPAGATLAIESDRALELATLAEAIDGRLQVSVDLVSSVPMLLRGTLVLNRRLELPAFAAERGALVTHDAQRTTMHLVARGALRIAAGARIDVSGKGLPGERTIDPLTGLPAPGSTGLAGGSHAGRGGSGNPGDFVAAPFDDPADPRFGGGGGGAGNGGKDDSWGGGLARLTGALVEIDGTVVADGVDVSSTTVDASGAGGSVVITAGTLAGAGSLVARGTQNAGNMGGGGGGGIVHLVTGTDAFAGSVSVAGGQGARGAGEDGVVFRRTGQLAPVVVSAPPPLAATGAALRYAARAAGTGPLRWTLTAGPADATVDDATGLLTWTPQAEGAFDFALTVSNPFGSAEQRFTLVALVPPSVTSVAATSGAVCVRYRYDGDGTPNTRGSPPLAWSLRSGPPGMGVDPSSGRVHWLPTAPGRFEACLEVSNAVGRAEQCFEVSVEGAAPWDDGGAAGPDCPAPAPLTVGCGCRGAAAPPVGWWPWCLAALARARVRRRSHAPH